MTAESEKIINRINETEAGHGRKASATVGAWKCDGCHESKKTICLDTSEGEYGGVTLCGDCLRSLAGAL